MLILKILLIILISAVALVLLALIGLNIAKYFIYGDYYSIEDDICKNPGLNDGFICQGIAASEENGILLISGYMADKSNSRIYITDLESNSRYVELTSDGEKYTGHAGGVAVSGDTVYIANSKRIFSFPLASLLEASQGAVIDIGSGTRVNTAASFVYTDDEYLYVGEFHDGGKYNIVGHEHETAEGIHHAVCTKYALDDLSAPLAVYTLRDKVQGICFTPGGKIVLSTSYGLADTVYYVYDINDLTDSGETLDGAPVYYLDKLERMMKGPAMGEDLDYYDGRIITLTESASNKYIFGKLFGANKIVALRFE